MCGFVASKAVKLPDYQHITGAHKGERLHQTRPIGFGTAHVQSKKHWTRLRRVQGSP
jgi:hypothetical protein